MRDPALTSHGNAVASTHRGVVDLMQSLDRIFKIGVYYPSGHALCDEAATQFLNATIRVVGKSRCLRIEPLKGVLRIQGVELDNGVPGARDFGELMELLGIAHVEIDKEVTPPDLQCFASRLLALRTRISSVSNFQRINFDGMPTSIRIKPRKFIGQEVDGADSGDTDNRTDPRIEDLLTSLAKQGLTEEQIATCRRLFESIRSDREEQQPGGALARVGWVDVENLLLRVVRAGQGDAALRTVGNHADRSDEHAAPSRSRADRHVDAISAIFESIRKDLDRNDSNSAIDLLVEMNRRQSAPTEIEKSDAKKSGADDESADTTKGKKSGREGDDSPESTLDEIRVLLSRCAALAGGSPRLSLSDRSEELSILLQILGRDPKPELQVRIGQLMSDVLASPLRPAEWDILVAGLRPLLDLDSDPLFEDMLVSIIDHLHRLESKSALPFILKVAQGATVEQLGSLWPFVMNEILLMGRPEDSRLLARSYTLMTELPEKVMLNGVPRLERLEALRDDKIVPDIFTPLPATLCPIFGELLERSRTDSLGESILQSMLRKPPDRLCKAIVPLLGEYHSRHRRILAELLRQTNNEEPTAVLAQGAGRLIAGALPKLARSRRGEPWVLETIRAIAHLPVPNAGAILRGIARGRRFLILHDWPIGCREAARETSAGTRD